MLNRWSGVGDISVGVDIYICVDGDIYIYIDWCLISRWGLVAVVVGVRR